MILRAVTLASVMLLASASPETTSIHHPNKIHHNKKGVTQALFDTAYGVCATVIGTIFASSALSAICDEIGNFGQQYLKLRHAYSQGTQELIQLDSDKVLSPGEIKFWSTIKAGSKAPGICAQEAIALSALLCIFYLSAKAVYSGVKILTSKDDESACSANKKRPKLAII